MFTINSFIYYKSSTVILV